MRNAITISVLLLPLVVPAWAKRLPPAHVAPIVHNGIVYSVPNENGKVAHLFATDAKNGGKLWQVSVFETKIDPKLEEDVQWVFIVGMKLSGNSVLLKDEAGRCWQVDIESKRVTRQYIHCLGW